jgi:hypothetical protein
MVNYTAKVLIPFKRVGVDALLFFPLIGVSTLLQKSCHKKQETGECDLKLNGYIYHQGTYTHQADTEKSA